MSKYKECYKYCFVPGCKNTTKSAVGKLFVTVPLDIATRKKWMNAVRRDEKKNPSYSKSSFYCCEDHFDKERDFENYRYVALFKASNKKVRIKLRDNVLPSKFECQISRLLTEKHSRSSSVVEKLDRKKTVEKLLSETFDNEGLGGEKEEDNTVDEERDDLNSEPEEEPVGNEQENFINPSIGIQVQPKMESKSVQARPLVRSKFVQVTVNTKSIVTSPLKRHSNLPMPVVPKVMRTSLQKEEEEEIEEESSLIATSSSDFTVESLSEPSSSSTSKIICAKNLHKNNSLKITTYNIETKSQLYLGIPPECMFIITTLSECTQIGTRDIMIVLKKLRCNQPFSMMADDFGLSESQVSKIFSKSIPPVSSNLKQLIYWPTNFQISLILPIPFRKNFHNVVAIIDCFEIQVEKPSNPLNQSLTWSNYYNCNTIKYFVSCTPNGFINFLSQGYGGRISDKEITCESGFLNHLPTGKDVMADRGFKHLDLTLLKQNCRLVRPPSVKKGQKLNKLEVTESRRIASLRVHIERVIGRIREYKIAVPHSTLDNKHVPYLDCIMTCIAGLVNLQSLII